jgi:predicted tellurium resistance membrane protein TerC
MPFKLSSHLTFAKMIRTWIRILPLLLLIGSSILLLEGLPILTEPVIEGYGLPFGTLITWVGIIMFPLSILMGIRKIRKPTSEVYHFYKRVFFVFTLLGVAWGGISYLLAGNWTYTFSNDETFKGSERAFNIFLIYTAVVISMTLLTFLIFGIHHLIINQKRKR